MVNRLLLIGVLVAASVGCEEMPRTYSTVGERGDVIFVDDFERATLGPNWNATGEGAAIVNGRLRIEDLRNHPLWLTVAMPDAARIEFDAWAKTEEGDIKVEVAGDGQSFAKSMNYVASGYVVIFGGWNNTQNAIIRKDEHGQDGARTSEPQVVPDKRYHFVVIRDGGDIRWEINGDSVLEYVDERPLRGTGQRFFAFSGWEAPVEFDNLRIEGLARAGGGES